MRPRDKTAAECANVEARPRIKAVRPEWDAEGDLAKKFASLQQMTSADVPLARSFVNYASAPMGAKKYDASTLSR